MLETNHLQHFTNVITLICIIYLTKAVQKSPTHISLLSHYSTWKVYYCHLRYISGPIEGIYTITLQDMIYSNFYIPNKEKRHCSIHCKTVKQSTSYELPVLSLIKERTLPQNDPFLHF